MGFQLIATNESKFIARPSSEGSALQRFSLTVRVVNFWARSNQLQSMGGSLLGRRMNYIEVLNMFPDRIARFTMRFLINEGTNLQPTSMGASYHVFHGSEEFATSAIGRASCHFNLHLIKMSASSIRSGNPPIETHQVY